MSSCILVTTSDGLLSVQVCTAKMNLSDEVDLEDYVSRPDKISAAEVGSLYIHLEVEFLLLHCVVFGFTISVLSLISWLLLLLPMISDHVTLGKDYYFIYLYIYILISDYEF